MTTTNLPPRGASSTGTSPSDGALRRGGALITGLFGLPWALTGATALSTPLPAIAASVVISAMCAITALLPRSDPRPRRLPHRWRAHYRTINVTQGAAITLVVTVAVTLAAPGWIAPLVCLAVGLHFLPIARVLDQPEYRFTAAALLVIGFAGVAVLAWAGPDAGRAASGIGAAIILWATSYAVALRP